MNSVSFGSTFRINSNHNNFDSQRSIVNFCEKNDIEYTTKFEEIKVKNGLYSTPSYKFSTSVIAPDSLDNKVEFFLANKGIKFKKLEAKDLLDKSKIESRIYDTPKNMRLVKVDTKKLEKLLSNQSNNIEHCEKDYNNYYKYSVSTMIKSGDNITATTLYIVPSGETVKDTVDYISKFGKDRLNEDQLSFYFVQRTDDPDYCMYFGMKDLGMDKVPVYVNNDTYKIGKALEIF